MAAGISGFNTSHSLSRSVARVKFPLGIGNFWETGHFQYNHSETRYYISSLSITAQEFGASAKRTLRERIRGYWGVENKVHYVRDVTQGEDASRIRTKPLPQIFAIARNFTLNLYRNQMFENMAQARAFMFIWVRHTQATF